MRWQNLSNEDERGRGRGFPWHGRTWWRPWRDRSFLGSITLEWNIKLRWVLGASFGSDDDRGFVGSVSTPLFSLYWGLPYKGAYEVESWEFSVRLVEGYIHWNLGTDPMGGWDSRDPWRWLSGCKEIAEIFFGSRAYSARTISSERVPIPFPEGTCMGTVLLEECSWKRPWWPGTLRVRRATVTPDKPSPVPGKGESEWDCGPDAIHSSSFPAHNAAEAVGHFMGQVLQTRRKRGAPWGYDEK